MRTSSLLALVFVLSGCLDVDRSHVLTLSEYSEPLVNITINSYGPTLHLGNSRCTTFKGSAMLNGEPLTKIDEGGSYTSVGIGKGPVPVPTRECRRTEWSLPTPLPDEALTELEIFDSTGRITFGVRHLGATRGMAYRAPAPTELRWGEIVELAWSPPTDDLKLYSTTLSNGTRNIPAASGEVNISEGLIRFRLPPGPRDNGSTDFDGELRVSVTEVLPWIEYCHPVPGRCGVRMERGWDAPPFTLPVNVR